MLQPIRCLLGTQAGSGLWICGSVLNLHGENYNALTPGVGLSSGNTARRYNCWTPSILPLSLSPLGFASYLLHSSLPPPGSTK